MSRYISRFILLLSVILLYSCENLTKDSTQQVHSPEVPPNIVILFADDMGYGDTGAFGHPTIQTPNLDRMAYEGQKWTSFYVAASVCTPSRAGLLTGRLPIRSGMCSSRRRVLFPDSEGGLPASEITIAEMLKEQNYKTAAIGKWHLGHLKEYLPPNHGFDYYFGIPYSNDMDRVSNPDITYREGLLNPKTDYFNVPIIKNLEEIERPADQTTITKRYTDETIQFIEENKGNPFFVYLAYSLPHVPLFRSKEFEGHSKRGIYGDVIEEIDWSVGEIMSALEKNGLAENTLVVFTSDNGPWLTFETHAGSAGLLRDGKGSTYEGGMREPTMFYWKGKLKNGVVDGMGSTLDLLPTIASLTGSKLPSDRILDGVDLSETLLKGTESPRKSMIYYWGDELYAYRSGKYKAHFITHERVYRDGKKEFREVPALYDLETDPGEHFDIGEQNADIITKIREEVEKHKQTIDSVENQLVKRSED
ncbi:MAG: sulfatase [Cyclobacteriaceae bacterium]|nr:sulfatase [Cyclobacteriaceae bacterium]